MFVLLRFFMFVWLLLWLFVLLYLRYLRCLLTKRVVWCLFCVILALCFDFILSWLLLFGLWFCMIVFSFFIVIYFNSVVWFCCYCVVPVICRLSVFCFDCLFVCWLFILLVFTVWLFDCLIDMFILDLVVLFGCVSLRVWVWCCLICWFGYCGDLLSIVFDRLTILLFVIELTDLVWVIVVALCFIGCCLFGCLIFVTWLPVVWFAWMFLLAVLNVWFDSVDCWLYLLLCLFIIVCLEIGFGFDTWLLLCLCEFCLSVDIAFWLFVGCWFEFICWGCGCVCCWGRFGVGWSVWVFGDFGFGLFMMLCFGMRFGVCAVRLLCFWVDFVGFAVGWVCCWLFVNLDEVWGWYKT